METRDHVESFARGLAVLRAFGPDRRRMTLSDTARITGLQRSAARRFLLTLCDLGYAVQHDRWFELTPRVLELGYGYLAGLRFPDIIETHLAGLTRVLGESSSAAILDGREIVYVARSAAPQRLMSVTLGIGSRLPAHAASLGLVLLAQHTDDQIAALYRDAEFTIFTAGTINTLPGLLERLAVVRRDGYAINDQELELGLRSLAVAVPARGSRPAFSINVATNAARVPKDELLQRILPAVRDTASQCQSATAMLV